MSQAETPRQGSNLEDAKNVQSAEASNFTKHSNRVQIRLDGVGGEVPSQGNTSSGAAIEPSIHQTEPLSPETINIITGQGLSNENSRGLSPHDQEAQKVILKCNSEETEYINDPVSSPMANQSNTKRPNNDDISQDQGFHQLSQNTNSEKEPPTVKFSEKPPQTASGAASSNDSNKHQQQYIQGVLMKQRNAPMPIGQEYYLEGKGISQRHQNSNGSEIMKQVGPPEIHITPRSHLLNQKKQSQDVAQDPKFALALDTMNLNYNKASMDKMTQRMKQHEIVQPKLRYNQQSKTIKGLAQIHANRPGIVNPSQDSVMQKKFFPSHFASSDVKYTEKIKGFSTARNMQNGSSNDDTVRKFGTFSNSGRNEEGNTFNSSTFSGSQQQTANSTIQNPPRQSLGGGQSRHYNNMMATTMTKGYGTNNSAFNKFPSTNRKPMTAEINMKRRKFTYQPRVGNEDESRLVSPRNTEYDQHGEPTIEDININGFNSLQSPRDFSGERIRSINTIDENQKMRNEFMRNEAYLKEQNTKLFNQLEEKDKEIQKLRAHLRELFVTNENKIVAASYSPRGEDTDKILRQSGAIDLKNLQTNNSVQNQTIDSALIDNSIGKIAIQEEVSQIDTSRLPSMQVDSMGSMIQPTTTKKTKLANTQNSMQSAFNVHQLYQDLYISDMKEEIDAVHSETNNLRQGLTFKDIQTKKLRQENFDLKKKLMMYRNAAMQNDTLAASKSKTKSQKYNSQRGGSTQQSTAFNIGSQKVNQVSVNDLAGGQIRLPTPVSGASMTSPREGGSAPNSSLAITKQVSIASEQLDQKRNILAFKTNPDQVVSETAAWTQGLKEILKAKTLRDIISETQNAIKKLLKADTVYFMMLDKRTIENYHKEHGKSARKMHPKNNCFFEVVLPSTINKTNMKDWEFEFKFEHLKSVEHGRITDGRFFVWPVVNYKEPDKKVMFIQIEHKQTGKISETGNRERRFLELVTSIMSDCIERINMQNAITEDANRAYEILAAFKPMLGKRKHVDIDLSFQKMLTKLFKFDEVGILFVDGVEDDHNSPNLFRINHLPQDEDNKRNLTEYDQERGFAGTVKFPKTIGMTGQAVVKKKVQVMQVGEVVSSIASELDNMVGVSSLDSIMIGACYDDDGVLRGAVQCVNKNDGERNKITKEDIQEFEAILPTFGEIFRTADRVRVIMNNMTNMWFSMLDTEDGIVNKLNLVEQNELIDINVAISYAQREVNAMLGKHKNTILKDDDLVKSILACLREDKQKKEFEEKLALKQAAKAQAKEADD